MSRAENRRKFNEAIINTLYPPPPPRPKDEELEANDVDASSGFDLFVPGDLEEVASSASGSGDDNDVEDGHENGARKLTRAQRKKLRRKKLKRAEPRFERRKIIGPLLPSMEAVCDKGGVNNGDRGVEPQVVRRNASEETSGVLALHSEAPGSCQNKSKVRLRRRAKKLASISLESRDKILSRDRTTSLTSSDQDNCDECDEDRETEKKN